ncbi:uncharacterized protein LOC122077523 [Macadamia integrifolia]|uniref:uncharacterized protein LOC122077523 n=1 Tax=Macadamia integrifolia TaxID=60698 RepID=UPI001C4ED8BA|nr:uncharacterized protein LOC122077523 [Macadamia integrifolia]
MSSAFNRWARPEVYPLMGALGLVISVGAFQLYRNLRQNPEVMINKAQRASGVRENFEEGERYSENALRKHVRNRAPQIMPVMNSYFSDPKEN